MIYLCGGLTAVFLLIGALVMADLFGLFEQIDAADDRNLYELYMIERELEERDDTIDGRGKWAVRVDGVEVE